jgi:hypothetical protein
LGSKRYYETSHCKGLHGFILFFRAAGSGKFMPKIGKLSTKGYEMQKLICKFADGSGIN